MRLREKLDGALDAIRSEDHGGMKEKLADLAWFFEQWIYWEYFPNYEYGWGCPAGSQGPWQTTVVIRQIQTNTGFFKMPVDLRLTMDDGSEETQVVHLNPVSGEWGDDYSALQRHVSLAIPFGAWEYYWTTEDVQFLRNYGAEMFIELARFWSSIATPARGRSRRRSTTALRTSRGALPRAMT